MASNAHEYAEQVGRGIWQAYEDGHVFGLAECSECGAAAGDSCDHDGEREPATAYDYMSEALDVDFVVSSRGDIKGVEVLISFGGPNAWIDTRSAAVVVAWGSDRASWALPTDMIRELEAAGDEFWEMSRG